MKFKARVVAICALIAAFVTPAIVAAQEAAKAVVQQEWWQTLLAWLLPIVGSIIATVVTTLLVVLIKRWGFELDEKQRALVQMAVDKGIDFAEGKALSALNAGKPKTEGAQKLASALEIAKKFLDEYKLPKMAEDKLVALIESSLGKRKEEERKGLAVAAVASAEPTAMTGIVVPKWAKDAEAGATAKASD